MVVPASAWVILEQYSFVHFRISLSRASGGDPGINPLESIALSSFPRERG